MPITDAAWPRADAWLGGGDPDDADVTLVGAPTSIGSLSPSHAWKAPAAIRHALTGFSTFNGETGTDLGQMTVADRGDLDIADLALPGALAAIEQALRSEQRPLIVLGGDNAVTRPAVNALAGGGLDRVGVLTLDAHHDVRTLERGPMNGTPIRGLIEDGLPGRNVVQIGIHSFANSSHYRRYCDEVGVRVVTMAEVDDADVEGLVGRHLDELAEASDWIYVDIDVDVLDRAFAPGCPGARPGGMTPRQLAAAALAVGRHPAVAAVDIVEVDPDRDVGGITVHNAANALLWVLTGMAQRG